MKKDFPFVQIPEHLKKFIGEPDPGIRLYRAYGGEEDMDKWFDAVVEICHGEGSVSPGGAAGYAKVSRPAVHKRLKEGRLTGFLFHVMENGKFFKDKKKLIDGGRPYSYIPVSECKTWANELKKRRDRISAQREAEGERDYKTKFMKTPRY
jgi:hypothetical protein